MAEKIEVNPLQAGAAFGTAQSLSVKVASGGEIVNREGNVKGRQGQGCRLLFHDTGAVLPRLA
jgi:hypothetical protein